MRIYWYADGTFEKATGASIFAESEDSNKIEFKLPMAEADSIVHATFLLPYPQNSEQFGHYIAESLLLHLEEDTEDGGYVWVGTIPGGYLANNGTAYISARVESNDLLVVKTTQQVQFEIQAGGAYQATAVLPEQGEQLEAELARQNLEILRLDDEKQDKADNSLETTNKTVVGGINELKDASDTQAGQISDINDDVIELQGKVADIEASYITGETFISQMTGTTLPTDQQLNAEVQRVKERDAKNGDVIIFVLQITGATDKNYKYIYTSDDWQHYELPALENAGNDTLGLVKGTYTVGATANTIVSIINGEIVSIWVKDNTSTYRDIREYANSLQTTITNILNGDTAVGKALKAVQDELGNNIVATYLTKTEGASKQYVRKYALPRVFNDVYFVATDGYQTTIPTTPASGIQFSTTTDAVGDFTLFEIQHQNSADFELSAKNSSQNAIFVSANASVQAYFRMTTQVYVDNEWQDLSIELSDLKDLTAGEIYKITFSSPFTALGNKVVEFADGSLIRQKLEVVTQTSTSTTYSVYSNETYPSTFNLNTQTETLVVAQGEIGQEPVIRATGVLENSTLTFTAPTQLPINPNTEIEFEFTYTTGYSTLNGLTQVVFKHGTETLRLVTPYNKNSGNPTINDLKQAFIDGTLLRFKGFVKELVGDTIIYVEIDDLTGQDTGATSIETTGDGNAVSSASYDAQTRKITLTKGLTALTEHQSIKELDTTETTAQSTNANEAIAGSGTIKLHKVAKTGTLGDLIEDASHRTVSDTEKSTWSGKQNALSQTQLDAVNSGADSTKIAQIATNTGNIATIEGKIPAQASSSNQLADKSFVNSSIQTATAHFRGNWDTWTDVPTNVNSYPLDDDQSRTPTQNDYLVVQDASDYPVGTGEDPLAGTWRFKYSGEWSVNGKNGWHPEYQVNETPLTSAQLQALNSGITSTLVGQIGTNQTNIGNLQTGKQDKIDATHKLDADLVDDTNSTNKFVTTSEKSAWNSKQDALSQTQQDAVNSGIDSTKVGQIATNKSNIEAIPNNYVSYSTAQNLTAEQQAQARANIGAGSSGFSGSYTDLTSKPILKTDNTTALTPSASETINGTLSLHKIAKTGTSTDLTDSADLVRQSELSAVSGRVGVLEGVVPSSASSSNKLVDTATMESAISTASATFRGTYNEVSDLNLTTSATASQIATALASTIATADNNDYCFVEIPTADATPTEIRRVDRYKYNGTTWSFEFTVNNSGFTTAQWQAINSGIDSTKVGQIATNASNISTLSTNKADKSATVSNVSYDSTNKKLKQTINGSTTDVVTFGANAFTDTAIPGTTDNVTSGSADALTSGGAYTALAEKADDNAVVKLSGDQTIAGTKNFTNGFLLNGSLLTDILYPIGSIFISTNNINPASFLGGSWTQLPAGYALWTASSGAYDGTTGTISASLPNIKGTYTQLRADSGAGFDCDGVLFKNSISTSSGTGTGSGGKKGTITFNANAYNSIYKDSATTVQPPAIKIYAWRRVSSSPDGTYKSANDWFNITYSTNSLTVTSFSVGHYTSGVTPYWTQQSSSPLTYTAWNNDQAYPDEGYKLMFNETSGNWEAYLTEDNGSTYTLVGTLTLQP